MQTARPRAGARISTSVHTLSTLTHLLSLRTQHYLGETADNKQTVDEEMMGVAWLLALQACLRTARPSHAAHTRHPNDESRADDADGCTVRGLSGQKRRQGDTCLKGEVCVRDTGPGGPSRGALPVAATRGDSLTGAARERALALRARPP